MAFCVECGKELEDGVKFCPVCGSPIAGGNVVAAKEETGEREETSKPVSDKPERIGYKDKHKVDRIVNLVCILASIPGSLVGWYVILAQLERALVSNGSADAELVKALISPIETPLLPIATVLWIISLGALVLSTVIVGTIWKMFRAGAKAFGSMIKMPAIVWILTVTVVPLTCAFFGLIGPLLLAIVFPVFPIAICTVNKQSEWKREELEYYAKQGQ